MRCVIEDEAGELWAGDWRGGIARFRDAHWELVRPPSAHRDMVRSLIALDGALWIGTNAGGLLRFKDGKTARISVDQGLPDNCIQQLLPDGQGSLWGGTPYRLFRISLDAVERRDGWAPGESLGHHLWPERWHAGRRRLRIGSIPRCWRTPEGELWFATANGAIHFKPATLRGDASLRKCCWSRRC